MKNSRLALIALLVAIPAFAQWARVDTDCVRETGETFETGYASKSYAAAVCSALNKVEELIGGSLSEAKAGVLMIRGGGTGVGDVTTPPSGGGDEGEGLPDETAPSVPQNLAVTAITPSAVGLSWSASTDNVGVDAYNVYRDGVLLDSTDQTTYTDEDAASSRVDISGVLFDGSAGFGRNGTALGALTDVTYSWWMQTEEENGGGGTANAWGVIDSDTTDVTHVTLNQDATGFADNSIYVYVRGTAAHPAADEVSFTNGTIYDGEWHHHTLRIDDGVTAYFVDGQQQTLNVTLNAYSGSQNFNQTMAFGARTHNGAVEGHGEVNLKDFAIYNIALSNVEIASLAAGTPPSMVQGGFRIRHWELDGDGTELIAGDTMTLSGASFNQGHRYTVTASDASMNESAASNEVEAVIPGNTPPAWELQPAPESLLTGTPYTLDLSDEVFDPDVDDTITITQLSGTLPTGVFFNSPLVSGTPSVSGQSTMATFRASDGTDFADVTISFETFSADMTAPPVPTGLAASDITSSSITWTWNASVDASGGAGELVSGTQDYRLRINGGAPITVTGLSHTTGGLSSSTQYTATIAARDAAQNESAQSSGVMATTLSGGGGGGGLTATGVSGTIADEQVITINALSGESFGTTGPVNLIYDDFKGGVHNQTISGQPFIGTRTVINPIAKYWTLDSHSPGASAVAIAGTDFGGTTTGFTGAQGSTRYFWNGKHETILVSYWTKFATGLHPYDNDQPPPKYGFHRHSVWKWLWLLESPDAFGNDDGLSDIVVPTSHADHKISITGNSAAACGTTCDTYDVFGPLVDGLGNSLIAWDQSWQRILAIHRPDAGTDAGGCLPDCAHLYFQILAPYNGMHVTKNGQEPNWVTGGGFAQANTNTTVKDVHHDLLILQDDFYIAGGPGAAARVEITDAASYGSSHDAAWCIVQIWSSSQIQCRLKAGPFTSNLANKYIHIHDMNNSHTNGGNGRLIH